MQLPDAEELLIKLTEQMRPHVRPSTCLVGIYTGGVWLAERLAMALSLEQAVGSIDVSFYRDDYGRGAPLRRDLRRSNIPFEVEGANIVIVDDVLYTGRTLRAALNELFDYGRPARVDLAVLADRGGRE
ncbi:MAG: bifunctional pyr operon transcriptional regulator/uracil phosphoribosyltransferase PyrR, partial [Gemmatimonadetes bacterium]|nr:bifunctional pyr operon transcriptional regulator/uracil phosphoribosyltransferase PyrR [Gemmatimonadota bacterium]